MHNVQRKILVVDDEVKIVEVVKSYLEKNGFNVIEAYTAKDALDKFENENPNLIILDLMLPDMSGEEICQDLRKIKGSNNYAYCKSRRRGFAKKGVIQELTIM